MVVGWQMVLMVWFRRWKGWIVETVAPVLAADDGTAVGFDGGLGTFADAEFVD